MRALIPIFLSVFSTAVFGQAPAQFEMVESPHPERRQVQIEVTEFFWYGCPDCFHMEPHVQAWVTALPRDVVFRRVPAVPNQNWAQLAEIYCTLEELGLPEGLHAKIFDAIHKERVNLKKRETRMAWLAQQGVSTERYAQAEASPAVRDRLQNAQRLTAAYKVDSVPMFIVDTRYYTTPKLAGGDRAVLEVVDRLIDVARAERKGRAQ